MSRTRLHVTTLLTDDSADGHRRRQAQTLLRARRNVDRDIRKTDRTQARVGRRGAIASSTAVPAVGERRPQALRTWLPLRLPAHRASSARLAGAYPFLTGAAPGAEGVPIGIDAYSGTTAAFDPWHLYTQGRLTNPNVLLAGVIGQGKSALAKSLAVRSVPFGIHTYVPCDVKGEWAAVANAIDGGVVLRIGLGSTTRLNPLDPGPKPNSVGSRRVAAGGHRTPTPTTQRGRRNHASVEACTRPNAPHWTSRSSTPASPPIRSAYRLSSTHCKTRRRNSHSANTPPSPNSLLQAATSTTACAASSGAISPGCSTGRPPRSSTPQPRWWSWTCRNSPSAGIATDLVGLVMTCASAWLESAIADPMGGRRWVIYDEAWRLLHILPLVRRMQAQWKLSRAYGIANLMVIHRLSDLDAAGAGDSEARALAEGLLTDCSTRIIYRQESDQLGRVADKLGLARPERELLPHLARGSGLWKIGRSSHVIHHRLHRCTTHANPEHEHMHQRCAPRTCERFAYSTDDAMTGGHR